ncbi:hypothetical protein O6H91_11G084000 [Diphasiastrum complanatum]|uniref:Uncharacterized protein n=1 Tax=Diphasiastrum complanatum TaxID=34168 RepID=A0ACC2CB51_DIPCM|nr:hypothetical protein O6H91_11G084000 [Diphasiastrum complanatum]
MPSALLPSFLSPVSSLFQLPSPFLPSLFRSLPPFLFRSLPPSFLMPSALLSSFLSPLSLPLATSSLPPPISSAYSIPSISLFRLPPPAISSPSCHLSAALSQHLPPAISVFVRYGQRSAVADYSLKLDTLNVIICLTIFSKADLKGINFHLSKVKVESVSRAR